MEGRVSSEVGELSFRLLGRVSAIRDGTPVDLGPPRQRTVLAALLLRLGEPVPARHLVEAVWSSTPPGAAAQAVTVYVSTLRRTLREVRISGDADGYQLEATPEAVDLHRFRRLVVAAGQGDPESALPRLGEALALWEGDPLGGLGAAPLVARSAGALAEERLAALRHRNAMRVALHRYSEAVAELSRLVTEHPLRQDLRELLMRALHLSGRRDEALAVFEDAERVLRREGGTEPLPALRLLREEIRNGRPGKATGNAGGREVVAEGRPQPGHPVPAQLPVDTADFTGRDELIDRICHLARSGEAESQVTVVVLDGMAGVGKTALAVRLGHRLSLGYPDGQLFLDLHGFTEGTLPLDPARALDRVLRDLGVPGEEVPPTPAERATLFRTIAARRRLLVLLDNAGSEEQVTPLLPAGPGSLVLVTSRRRLPSLPGVRPFSLGVLDSTEAAMLFRRVAGPERLGTVPPEEVDELVDLCGRLPLAVRIAAARLRARPTWSPRHLARRLRDERRRLGELEEERRSVAAAFQVSYRQLRPAQRKVFRSLGLLPGPDVDVGAAAAVAGSEPWAVERSLEDLVDSHLLEQHLPDRYRFHDLIRAHAATLAEAVDDQTERRTALHRLLDYWLVTARAAVDRMDSNRTTESLAVAHPPRHVPTLTGPGEAGDWLETELANLVAAVERAAGSELAEHSWRLADVLWRFFHLRGYLDHWVATHEQALDAARRHGDRWEEATVLHNLGTAYWRLGQLPCALDHYQRALAVRRELGDRTGTARSLGNLGLVLRRLGRLPEARERHEAALALFRRLDDRPGEARALGNLSIVEELLGDLDGALARHRHALAVFRELDDRPGEARTLGNLAILLRKLGRESEAEEHDRGALTLFRQLGDRSSEAMATAHLAAGMRRDGDLAAAEREQRRALELAEKVGDPGLVHEVLLELGETLARSDPRAALAEYRKAAEVAESVGNGYQRGQALERVGDAHRAMGDAAAAAESWRQALACYQPLEVPEAASVAERLAALGGPAATSG
ncbi:DNA-binding transcriptional activator of the SARP family [Actinoalloteichus cyanogriseus DSM 43889]|uniref:DNA-binding transcriptional activator of the SARP family n=1 Tax=Actinoalloteichus caeruleus DSM 43889 TaxID=1120930 RepID=A0ABT1JB87_ACTCY|nr:DNA-binding transcriptional activator of the SARP family [Actinoalloteichus caeruleus DSM 43889]